MLHTNNITELVFILDKSGSMAGLEEDTIGGFNAMLEKQRREEGVCHVSTLLFNHQSTVLHDRIPLELVPPMTRNDYFVGGSTALIDAIGGAIHHIELIHKYARPEDVPANTLFVITTDGRENASTRYSAEEIRAKIQEKKAKSGWEFLFIGANIDAVETAAHFGIDEDRAVNYHADPLGTQAVYDSVSDAVSSVRESRPLKSGWSARIDQDYKSRKKHR
ncbi:MAG: VWA domain-containing protein [Ruminococcaceae bacterium]|nr:VWA domain-containing protein [Oscillospiraceae bacterium]